MKCNLEHLHGTVKIYNLEITNEPSQINNGSSDGRRGGGVIDVPNVNLDIFFELDINETRSK